MDADASSLQTDEVDISIVDVLSVNPRASWARVADITGLDPGTVARRWRRLQDHGLAWAVCARGTRTLDNVHDHMDIRCRPGHAHELATALSDDPRCVTVSTVTGGADVRVLVDVPDLATLNAFLAEPQWRAHELESIEHNIALAVHHTARGWTSGGISATQRESLQPGIDERRRSAPLLSTRDRQLAGLLQTDVRMPVSDIAERLGVSAASASRHLHRLVSTRAIQLRAEASHHVIGWPWSVGLYLDVPAARVKEAARLVTALPGCRGSYVVANPSWNLMTILWMRDPADVHRIQARIEAELTDARIVSRQFTLRHYKRMGVVFDADGRAERMVPTPL